ncbi:MAG: hypothetical protein F9K24_09920 [Leptonema illini]|uniref:Ankyrin repeat domain-containing protein n=1 Tax=Leptonema illini TaxID=183 RepID=A0A833H1N8_9LEPT|nr:MAG: hypothetical protein F9K24_09920 [Leptonema illini]
MSSEIIELTDGSGRISIAGDQRECVLLFDGLPVGFTWDDCGGSIGQYLTRGTAPEKLQKTLDDIRRLVSGIDTEASLADSLAGLLALFENGQYVLSKGIAHGAEVLDFPLADIVTEQPYPFYCRSGSILICTQPSAYLDKGRVAEYRDQILSGARPYLIVAEVFRSDIQFVMDGHHKLEAYRQADIKPHLIEISRTNSRGLTLEDGLRAFGDSMSLRSEYARVKERRYDPPRTQPRLPLPDVYDFIYAAEQGDVEKITSTLAENPEFIDEVTPDFRTALISGSMRGQTEVVSVLLSYNPRWDLEDEDHQTALHAAAIYNHPEVIRLLIQHGVPADIENVMKNTPLIDAAINGFTESVQVLLELGAQVNPKNGSALYMAAVNENLETVRYLLEAGADPEWNRPEWFDTEVREWLDDAGECTKFIQAFRQTGSG